jgi:formylglycine-generating enzyme required for sulfatase activity
MHGNVTEWLLECGMPPYSKAVDDGALVNTGQSCGTHGVRGGAWDSQAAALTIVRRGFGQGKSDDRGIRLLREL